jgi:hypothetical protein
VTHTPGPWSTFQDPSLRHSVGTATGRICDMWGQDPAFYTEEDAANARLIASAPELLEACEVASQFFEANDDFTDCGEFPYGRIPGFILDMRIAIAKATGRRR